MKLYTDGVNVYKMIERSDGMFYIQVMPPGDLAGVTMVCDPEEIVVLTATLVREMFDL